MNALIIEASGSRLHIAARLNDKTAFHFSDPDGRHDQRLIPAVRSVLAELDATYTDFDQLGVGVGPGSFTGVRVALAFVQGLASGLSKPVVPLDSLALMALQAGQGVWHVAEDARLGEAYVGRYNVSDDQLQTVQAPYLSKIDDLSVEDSLLGSAWALLGHTPVELPPVDCHAWFDYLLTCQSVSPEALEPRYLRDQIQWKKITEQPNPLA